MKSSRTLRIIGEINEESYREFSEQLEALELQSNKPINIELNSSGGTTYDAIAFGSRIKRSPCETIITGYGLVASAAVLILASGTKRRLTRCSWVMVHEDQGKVKGSVSEMEKELTHLRDLEDQWADMLSQLTKSSKGNWALLHKYTTYLRAKQCLELGLIEEII